MNINAVNDSLQTLLGKATFLLERLNTSLTMAKGLSTALYGAKPPGPVDLEVGKSSSLDDYLGCLVRVADELCNTLNDMSSHLG